MNIDIDILLMIQTRMYGHGALIRALVCWQMAKKPIRGPWNCYLNQCKFSGNQPFLFKRGKQVRQVRASRLGTHALAVTAAGTVWGWGNNYAGQIAQYDTATRFSPVLLSFFEGFIYFLFPFFCYCWLRRG
jgi:hypothetical protein